MWYGQLVTLLCVGFLLASVLIWQVNRPLSVLSAYCLYSYLFICQQHPRALICLVLAYIGIGLICLISKLRVNASIYTALMCMAAIQFMLLMFQKVNLDPFFHSIINPNLSDTVGFVGSHNQLGIYYAVVAPILFHFCFPAVAMSVIAICFSMCSAASLGALAGILTYAWFMKMRWAVWLIIAGTLVSVLLMCRFDNVGQIFSNRVKLWKQTVVQTVQGKINLDLGKGVNHILTANPLTGFGMGSFIMLSPKSQGDDLFKKGWSYENTPRWEHAHNDLVEFFFEFGWLGLPILIWLALDILTRFLKASKTNLLVMSFSSLIAILVTSLGVYVIHAPVSYFMLCLAVGLFYREAEKGLA